jgi:Leucine-rich repeat (LRR) protein
VISIKPSNQSLTVQCEARGNSAKCSEATITDKPLLKIIPYDFPVTSINRLSLAPNFFSEDKNNLKKLALSDLTKMFPNIQHLSIVYYTIDSMIVDNSMASSFEIYLKFNNLTSFKSTMTAKKVLISHVTVSSNAITELGKDAFKNMINIVLLNFASNKISSIHSKTFKGMKKLSQLLLSFNPLKVLQVEVFQSLPSKLSYLILSDLALKELPRGAFKNFVNLNILKLDKNNLESFSTIDLELSYCNTLDLSENRLTTVNFTKLKGLDVMSLRSNNLTSFNAANIGLTSCRLLLLALNKIAAINFADIQKLAILDMSYNCLIKISLEMFPQKFTLDEVSFRFNKLEAIDRKFAEKFKNRDPFMDNPCAKTEKVNRKTVVKLNQCFMMNTINQTYRVT